jgi:hypothetical protein
LDRVFHFRQRLVLLNKRRGVSAIFVLDHFEIVDGLNLVLYAVM